MEFSSSKPPSWALDCLTLEQLQKLAASAPHLHLDAQWQDAILLRLLEGVPACEWDSAAKGAFLNRVQVTLASCRPPHSHRPDHS